MKPYWISCILALSCVWKCVRSEACHIVTTDGDTVPTIIHKTPNDQNNIWIWPTGDFKIWISLEVDNTWTIGGPFVIEQKLLVTPQMLGNCSSDWHQLKIRVDTKHIANWGNPIIIVVSLTNQTHTLNTNYWWRKYRIENIITSAVGNVFIAVGCRSQREVEEIDGYDFGNITFSAKRSGDESDDILSELSSSNLLSILIYSMIPIIICLILLATATWLYRIRRKRNHYANHKDEAIYEELKIENLGKLDDIVPDANFDQRYIDFVTIRAPPPRQDFEGRLDSRNEFSRIVEPSVRYDSPRPLPPLPDSIYLEMGSRTSNSMDANDTQK